jgi:hypothetical protein
MDKHKNRRRGIREVRIKIATDTRGAEEERSRIKKDHKTDPQDMAPGRDVLRRGRNESETPECFRRG